VTDSVATGLKSALPAAWLAEVWLEWEQSVFQLAAQAAREVVKRWYERLDVELAKVRDRAWRMVGLRRHTLVTPWGAVIVRRRLYRRGRECLFLLDRLLGWHGRRSVSPAVAQLAVTAASWLPYRKASALLTAMGLPLSAMTIHRQVQEVGGAIATRQADDAQALFTWGELPPSEERTVERLYLEADGVWVALQREARKRAEVWTAISYEGWQPVGRAPNQRYRLAGKQVFSEVATRSKLFWQRQVTALHRRYDFRTIREWVLSGDGANWIWSGAAQFPGCVRQLDRFHLARALRTGLGPAAGEAYQACVNGRWTSLAPLWRRAIGQARGQQAELIRQQRQYLQGQAEALEDYRLRLPSGPECRSLGAIESNGDKLIKNRLAKRGMSWTVAGAQAMVKVLQEQANGRLSQWLGQAPLARLERPLRQAVRVKQVLAAGDDDLLVDGDWLAARLPLLTGPGPYGPLFYTLKEACRDSD
jgi:hypothetical protein